MRVFGLEITRAKQATGSLTPVPYSNPFSFFGPIRESFAGAWQRGVYPESQRNIFAFSAVYACVNLIAADIAKLRPMLTQDTPGGYWIEVSGNSPLQPVLSKPNRYQTRIQFFHQWITSKLMYGNAYILKERDQRGVVTGLYVLDPRLVVPLVASDGSVYYQLKIDHLSGVQEPDTYPASEIIHDRMITLWHPLVGVSPIFACGAAATQGIRIQANSASFFENMSRPSGMLTAPGKITDETALRIKNQFEPNFSAGNLGRLFVAGDGLVYAPMTIPAEDAQLIQQLNWTIEDVARCFQVPLHKISQVAQRSINYASIGALNQDYYTQTLQFHIESLELLLDEGLGLDGPKYNVTLDLEGLLRLDPAARIDTAAKGVGSGIYAPNEGRAKENLPPVKGGEMPFLQQQNWTLEQLADRVSPVDAPGVAAPAAAPSPSAPAGQAAEDQALALANALIAKFTKATVHA
jgi:HK97 family phage portal protein